MSKEIAAVSAKVIQKKDEKPQEIVQINGDSIDILNLIRSILLSFTNNKKLSEKYLVTLEKDLAFVMLCCIAEFKAFEKEGSFSEWLNKINDKFTVVGKKEAIIKLINKEDMN